MDRRKLIRHTLALGGLAGLSACAVGPRQGVGAATKAPLGADPWSYGVAANRAELEAICRWSHAQHLSRRRLAVADIFAPDTLES